MMMQFVPNNGCVVDPTSQYQQYGTSQQFMMQPSPMMYQAPMTPTKQEASFPQAPPGVFHTASTQQPEDTTHIVKAPIAPSVQDNVVAQNPSGVVFMQMFVPVPVYDPSMQQVQNPQGSLCYANPWGWSGSAPQAGSKAWNGAKASRKKLTGAAHAEEVQEVKRALQDKMKLHSVPTLRRVTSKNSQASTTEGLSDDAEANDSHDNSRQTSSEVADFESPAAFAEKVDIALVDLDSEFDWKCQNALQWVSESFWTLALNKKGCRVVQKAMDVGTPVYRLQLLTKLEGHVTEAVQSPHANYVLQKFIELAPPERLQFIFAEVQDNVLYIARHRFGCRILQRLLEHCKPWQTEQLINKALANAAPLCRHQYGNFILQHILQYGSMAQRSAVADVILEDIIRLSKHRLASHIVSCALVNCSPEDVRRLTHAVLQDEVELYNLSRREYGSFVVREVHRASKLLENMTEDDAQTEYERRFGLQTDEDAPKEIEHATNAEAAMLRQYTGESEHAPYALGFERQCTMGAYMD